MPASPASGGQLGDRPPNRVAVLHALPSGEVAILLATRAPARDGEPAGVSIERHQVHAPAGVAAALASLKPEAVIGLLPTSQCVVRMITGPVPTGTPGEVQAALALLAETNLPETIPSHRRGAGVVAAGSGVGVAAIGWSGGPPAVGPGVSVDAWVPFPLGLAGLVDLSGGAGVSVQADVSTGTIAVACAGEQHAALRVLRDDPTDQVGWDEVVASALSSAERFAGQGAQRGGTTEASRGALVRPARLRVSGVPSDEAWWSRFGAMTGAAWAVLRSPSSDDAGAWSALRPLLDFTDEAPRVRARPWVSIVNFLGRPRVAAAVGVACVAALLAAPLGLAYARLSVLREQEKRSPGTDAQYAAAQEQADFYALLRDQRWPVTQLLGEVVGSAPAGVTLDSITADFGQPIRVTGTTSDDALVREQWRAALQDSKVFDEVRLVSIDNSSPPTRFTLELKVGNPSLALARDLAKLPPVAAPEPEVITEGAARPGSGSEGASGRSGGGPRGAGASGSARESRDTRRESPAAAPAPVPPALTGAQIDAMDRSTAMKEWALRRGASQRPGLDDATRARLQNEVTLLDQRRRTAPAGNGGGGGGS